MRDRWQDPNWEHPNTDVPGYEWRDTGAATSASGGAGGRWPEMPPDRARPPRPPRPPQDRRPDPNQGYGPRPEPYGQPFGDHRYGRPDEWSSQQSSWPNHPARFEDTTSGRGPEPEGGGAGMGAGMYWNGTSAREDEQMWRPSHDRPDPGAWHRGTFAGRGPRGYQRSDARIGEDVNDHLTDDEYLDASDISITIENGVVVLEGMVDSRDAKRRAEDVAASVSGVHDVMNRLDVRHGGVLERIGDALS